MTFLNGGGEFRVGFLRREDEKLEAGQVRRIIAALDEKCRDVDF